MLTEYSMTLMANGTRYCLRKDIDFIDRVRKDWENRIKFRNKIVQKLK